MRPRPELQLFLVCVSMALYLGKTLAYDRYGNVMVVDTPYAAALRHRG